MELYADIRPGQIVRVHQVIKETTPKGEIKERIQIYEGLVLKRSHRKEDGATIIVYKKSGTVGVEKIFPLKSPTIKTIEIVRAFQVRRADISYAKTATKKMKEKRTVSATKPAAKKAKAKSAK
ncbi:MAG: 50S ribosomal protein L19 [Candidatus Magasanikbacteria bacterium]|nr:50S ribosomal protein L19 [Candidatus Magasanikbacteria bacterium]